MAGHTPHDARGHVIPNSVPPTFYGQFRTFELEILPESFRKLSEADGFPTGGDFVSLLLINESETIQPILFDEGLLNFDPAETDPDPPELKEVGTPLGIPLAVAEGEKKPSYFTPPMHPSTIYVFNPDAGENYTLKFVLTGRLEGVEKPGVIE